MVTGRRTREVEELRLGGRMRVTTRHTGFYTGGQRIEYDHNVDDNDDELIARAIERAGE